MIATIVRDKEDIENTQREADERRMLGRVNGAHAFSSSSSYVVVDSYAAYRLLRRRKMMNVLS